MFKWLLRIVFHAYSYIFLLSEQEGEKTRTRIQESSDQQNEM